MKLLKIKMSFLYSRITIRWQMNDLLIASKLMEKISESENFMSYCIWDSILTY